MNKYIIGVDIGGTRTKYGLVDIHAGKVIHTLIQPTERKNPETFINQIGEAISQFGKLTSADAFGGIGFGVPGFVDEQGNVVTTYGFLEFMLDYPLKSLVEEKFSIPCRLDNDARIVSLGEAMFGKGKDFGRVLTLTLGTGVGFGFVVCGSFMNALPVEHMGGHISIMQEGDPCYCGKIGCLESLVSSTGIISAIKKLKEWDREITAEAVFDAAKDGDEDAIHIVEQLIVYLQAGVYNYANLLAPDVVVLGGGIAKGMAPYLYKIKEASYLSPFPGYHFELVVSELGELAGILGSAALFHSSFSKEPKCL